MLTSPRSLPAEAHQIVPGSAYRSNTFVHYALPRPAAMASPIAFQRLFSIRNSRAVKQTMAFFTPSDNFHQQPRWLGLPELSRLVTVIPTFKLFNGIHQHGARTGMQLFVTHHVLRAQQVIRQRIVVGRRQHRRRVWCSAVFQLYCSAADRSDASARKPADRRHGKSLPASVARSPSVSATQHG